MELDWDLIRAETEVPFTTSRSSSREITRVWVRVSHQGREGWGEADPSRYYGESAATGRPSPP